MKTLSIASFCFAVLCISGMAQADQLTERCSGISTSSAKVIVMVYRGENAAHAGADALVVVSESTKGRRVFAAKITGGNNVSQVLTSGNNYGMKLTMHQVGAGYLWLGDGSESFGLTCQKL